MPAHLSLTYPEFLNTYTSPEISGSEEFSRFLVDVVSCPEQAINFNKRLKFSWVLFRNARKGRRFHKTHQIKMLNLGRVRAKSSSEFHKELILNGTYSLVLSGRISQRCVRARAISISPRTHIYWVKWSRDVIRFPYMYMCLLSIKTLSNMRDRV